MCNLSSWIPTVLRFKDWPDIEFAYDLWVSLGVDNQVCTMLVDLQMRFEDDHLFVAEKYSDSDEVLDMIAGVLMSIWKYVEWSDSRWVGMGMSSRALVASMITGIDSLFEHIRAKGESQYYIGGFGRCVDDTRRCIVVSAISSWLSDSVLQLLLEDDRVPMQIDLIDAEILTELDYITNMPEPIMQVLAQAARCSSRILRSEITSAALVSASYTGWKLRPAKQLPWSLCGHDRAHKVRQLMTKPRPIEPTAQKIYDLMVLQFPIETILEGIRLLESISWSSTPTEQGHLPASKLVQSHRTYCQDSVRCRAVLSSCRPLLAPTAEQVKQRVLAHKLERLNRRQPQKFGGRQAYFQEVMVQAKELKLSEGHPNCKVQNTLMAKHGAKWQKLSDVAKQKYQKHADHGAVQTFKDLEEAKDNVRGELRNVRQKSCESTSSEGPWRMTSCRFSAAEIADFNSMWDAPEYTESEVNKRRESCLLDRQRPSDAFQTLLSAHDHPPPLARAPKPWLKGLVYLRDYFGNCIFKFEHGGVSRLVKFVFGLQNPQTVGFVGVVARDVASPNLEAENYEATLLSTWRFEYEWLPQTFTWSDGDEYSGEDIVSVQSDVVHLLGRRLVSDSDWKPLEEVMSTLPPIRGPANTRVAAAARPRPDSSILEAEPWVLDYLGKKQVGASAGSGPRLPGPAGERTSDDEEQDALVVDSEQVFDELEALRRELGVAGGDRRAPFSWTVLGGAWTMAHKDVAYDAFQAKASSTASQAWAREHGLNITCRFSVKLIRRASLHRLVRVLGGQAFFLLASLGVGWQPRGLQVCES
jgi:hypothetical protein